MASQDSGFPGGGRPLAPGMVAPPAAPRPSARAGAPTPSSPPAAPVTPTTMVAPDVMRVLQAAEVFRGFTETGLQIVGTIAQKKQIPANTPLFVENMIGDGLFIIADGLIRISVRGPNNQDVSLTVLGPNECLGEAALLRPGPRMCSATAEVPSTVIEITRRDIAGLQRTKPQACLKLMMGVIELMGHKMRETQGEYRKYLAWRMGLGG